MNKEKTEENILKNKYVLSCSFGKDSLATALLAIKYNEPLDEIFYCRVMYDNKRDISAESPDHEKFIHDIAIPYFEKLNIKVVVYQSKNDYISLFNHRRIKGKYVGKKNGFPLMKRCIINSDCKMKTINEYEKDQKNNRFNIIHYVGIAIDEKERLERLKGKKNHISLMEKYNITENQAIKMCKEKGLYSPLYNYTNRGGVGSVLMEVLKI